MRRKNKVRDRGSLRREVRAIAYVDLPAVDPETGAPVTLTKNTVADYRQQLADAYGIHVDYAGSNKVIATCARFETDPEHPGDLLASPRGVKQHAARMVLAHDKIKGHPSSDPADVHVNHGFDALTAPLPEELVTQDDEGNPVTPPSYTPEERFARRMTRFMGEK